MRRPSRQGLLRYCQILTGLPISPERIFRTLHRKSRTLCERSNCARFRTPHRDLQYVLVFAFPVLVLTCFDKTPELSAQSWKDLPASRLELARNRKPAPAADISNLEAHPDSVLSFLAPFASDSNTFVRIKACEMIHLYAQGYGGADVRKKSVELLTLAAAENCGAALDFLKGYSSADFDLSSKKRLVSLLNASYPYLNEVIRICAVLRLPDIIPRLKAFSVTGYPPATRWAALVSMARTGDADAATEMLSRVKRLAVDDNLVYHVFPDLVFSRNRDAIQYLVTTLYSEDKNCLSADVERETAIPCGYRVMELLAPVVRNFPFKIDKSGDLIAGDYKHTLAAVRQWFLENENFEIESESY